MVCFASFLVRIEPSLSFQSLNIVLSIIVRCVCLVSFTLKKKKYIASVYVETVYVYEWCAVPGKAHVFSPSTSRSTADIDIRLVTMAIMKDPPQSINVKDTWLLVPWLTDWRERRCRRKRGKGRELEQEWIQRFGGWWTAKEGGRWFR